MSFRISPFDAFHLGSATKLHPMKVRTRNPLRIAQVSPLYESVPPKLYGGTERVVSYLTEELVQQGHEVTLFARGASVTAANLILWFAEVFATRTKDASIRSRIIS